MKLTHVYGKNIKGGDVDLDLGPLTALYGEAEAGKTARLDVVQLVLVGHLPRLGNRNQATFELSSGPVMEVGGTFDDGSRIRRTWRAKGDSVKAEHEVPERIEALAKSGVLTTMLDAGAYFAMGPKERREYVFANCPLGAGAPNQDTIAARVEKAAPSYPLARFTASLLPELKLQDWLAQLLVFVRDDWKAHGAKVDQMQETIRGLTHLRALDAQSRPLAAAEEARESVRRRIVAIQTARQGDLTAYGAQVAAGARRIAIARELVAFEKDLLARGMAASKLDLVKREILNAQEPQLADAPAVRLERQATARAARDSANSRVIDALRKIEEAATTLSKVEGRETCPFCGASGTGWKVLRIQQLSDSIKALRAQGEADSRERAQAQTELDGVTKEIEAANAAAYNLQQLRRSEDETVRAIASLDARLARRTALEEERDRLPLPDAEIAARVDASQTELNVANDEVRALDAEIRTAAGRVNDLKRLAEAEATRDASEKGKELAAAAGKELVALQSELVAAAFAPLLETANLIFGRVLKAPLEYRDDEIGMRLDGNWVTHRVLSGSAQQLAYAAIQAALAATSPCRIMLLDELGNMTTKRATAVARALVEAVAAGVLEQVVCVDPERPSIYGAAGPEGSSSFTVVEVRE